MMRFVRRCTLLVLLATGCGDRDPSGGAPLAAARSESDRIHEHLVRVEQALRSEDVSHLMPAQKAARRQALDRLSEYREGRRYPHNHVRPGRTPVFVDPHGTPCAVAYLMLRSGAHALVEDVARTSNLARVPELAGDPRLARWLEANGLTLEEATRIQPAYGRRDTRRPGEGYTLATATFGMATAMVAAHNVRTRNERGAGLPLGSVVGLGLGLTHLGLTAHGLTNDDPVPVWAVAVNMLGTTLSTLTSVRRARAARTGADEATAAIEPLVMGGADGLRLGLSVRH